MLSQVAKDILVKSPIYSALLEMELKPNFLEGIRIRENSFKLPFHSWSLYTPGDLPLDALFYATSLAVYRCLLEGITLSLADKTAAWYRVAVAEKNRPRRGG